jgi:hypothetical protein
MANTPNSRKIALEAAKEQRERIINEQAIKEIELSNAQTQKERTKIQKELNRLLQEEANVRARIAAYEDKSSAIAKSITDSLQEQKALLDKKRNISSKINDLESKASALQQEILDSITNQTDNIEELQSKFKELNKEIEKELKLVKEAEDSAKSFLNDISSAISKVPLLGGALSKGFDAFLKSSKGKKLATDIASKLFNPGSIKASSFKLGLLGAGVALTGAGIKAGLGREQELKDQQRAIGLTNKEVAAVDKIQRRLLNSSDSMVTSMEEARKASAELVEDFGKLGVSSSLLVDQQVKLTNAFGLTGEEASNFQRTSTIIGRSTEESKLAVLATAEGFNKITGSTQSLSGTLRTVSRLSDAIRIQFRGSDEELTNAVMKAKMLGTTLEELNGIADQLLNIESSIESQVTAQLVTGRNINLDKARMFALADDMNGLMDELVKQEIDYASYSKMNRIEKQATATALGMNVDQMAKFVSQQELARQLNIDMAAAENRTSAGLEESLKSNQERIAQMAKAGNLAAKQYMRENEALTTQEKMTAAVEQMAQLFKIMAPIITIIGVAMTAIAIASLMAASSLTFGIAGAAAIAVAIKGKQILQGMATGGDVIGGQGPVVVGENGPEIVRLRRGNSVTPNSQLNTVGNNNKETNDLLRQLITKIDQPVIIKMGDTTINELGNKINLSRNYQAGIGNTYNRLS